MRVLLKTCASYGSELGEANLPVIPRVGDSIIYQPNYALEPITYEVAAVVYELDAQMQLVGLPVVKLSDTKFIQQHWSGNVYKGDEE
jgi:hypothetical protein